MLEAQNIHRLIRKTQKRERETRRTHEHLTVEREKKSKRTYEVKSIKHRQGSSIRQT